MEQNHKKNRTEELNLSKLEKVLSGIAIGLGIGTICMPESAGMATVYVSGAALVTGWVAMGYLTLNAHEHTYSPENHINND